MPNNSCSRSPSLVKTKNDSKRKGTRSTIELTWRGNKLIISISCHASLIAILHLPSEDVDQSDYFEGTIGKDKKTGNRSPLNMNVMSIVHQGNDYVTVYIPQKVMSRHEIRDTLYGNSWRLDGSCACSLDKYTVHEEVWTIS